MKQHLFIILTLMALSACSAIDDVTNSITGDDTDNTGGDSTGGNNNADNNETNTDKNYTGAFTSFNNIPANSAIDFNSTGLLFSSRYLLSINIVVNHDLYYNNKFDFTLHYDAGMVQQVTSDNALYTIDGLITDAGFISGGKTIKDDYSYSDSFFTMANPNDASRQWNYQSYILTNDINYNQYGKDKHVQNYYAYSIGSRTLNNDLPTSGTAIFRGDGSARYKVIDNKNELWENITFSITASASFNAGKVTIVATETGTTYGVGFTGQLSHDYKKNNLSGIIASASDFLGQANASFYGDDAQELGGEFFMCTRKIFAGPCSADSNRILIGAFGAKRE